MQRPWRKHPVPTCPPTMLAKGELALLNWLTSCYHSGVGAIIDAGCFLGGSTVALASGLRSGVVHSYDIFNAGTAWFDGLTKYDLKPGDSFEDRYRENIRGVQDRVVVHSGNLLDQRWGDEPVEILFLDICKTDALHDHAAAMWFPRLIPGRSIVIQQDYGSHSYARGNVMMEVYQDNFKILDDIPYCSRVYLCTKAITDCPSYVSIPNKLELMAIALNRSTPFRDALLFSAADLAEKHDRPDLVKEYISRLQRIAAKPSVIAEAVQRWPRHFAGKLLKVERPGWLSIVRREVLRLVRQAA